MDEIRWGSGVPFHLHDICSLDAIAAIEWVMLLHSRGTYEMETRGYWSRRWWQSEMMFLILHGQDAILSVRSWTIIMLFPSIIVGTCGSSAIYFSPIKKAEASASSGLQRLRAVVSPFMNSPKWSQIMIAAALWAPIAPSTLIFRFPSGAVVHFLGWLWSWIACSCSLWEFESGE